MVQRVKPWTRWYGGALSVSMSGSGTVSFDADASGTGAFSAALSVAMAGSGELTEPEDLPSWLESDWQYRTSGTGVVWFHDFRTAAEVNQFRWANGYGNDPLDKARPGMTAWVSDDGITGGCLEIRHAIGGTPNPPEWWRPFSPLDADSNGRGEADPGANGTITPLSFTPTDGGSQMFNFGDHGFYGHADYHDDDAGAFDGDRYWFQARVKISENRAHYDDGGKLFYFTLNDISNSDQEIVTMSSFEVTALGANRNLFQMYRSGGTPLVDDDPTSSRQVGTEYGSGVCRTSPSVDASGCWFTPNDETSEGAGNFFTLLYEVVPGHDSGGDTIVRVWKAEYGETEYTKIWDQDNVDLPFEPSRPFGHNALICSCYQNVIEFSEQVYHRYAQLIFSKNWIPPPQVYNLSPFALAIAADALKAGESAAGPGDDDGLSGLGTGAGSVRQTIQWGNVFFYDHERRVAHMIGKDASAGSGDGARSNNVYDATTGTWHTSGRFHIDGNVETGHLYESFAYDPKERALYIGRWNQTYLQKWVFGSDPESGWTTTEEYGSHWMPNSTPTAPPLAWHPNLFGLGDGGLVILRNVNESTDMELLAWRKSTGTFHSIPGTQHKCTNNPQLGACRYVRSGDYVIGTSATGNTYKVPAGYDGSLGTAVQIENPPIPCRYSSGGTVGILIDDPTGLGAPYILEKAGNNRVWRYDEAEDEWTLQSYTHPFPRGSTSSDAQWYVASCFPLGVFWCVNQTGTPRTLLWRPE